jgi:hypothetical protein
VPAFTGDRSGAPAYSPPAAAPAAPPEVAAPVSPAAEPQAFAGQPPAAPAYGQESIGWQAPASMPDVEAAPFTAEPMPAVEMPAVEMPAKRMPAVEMPAVEMADLKPLPAPPPPFAPPPLAPLAPSALSPVDLSALDPGGPKAALAASAGPTVPAVPTARVTPAASPATPAEPARPTAPAPSRGAQPRLQPIPDRSASALLVPGRRLTEERAWLRRSLSKEYDHVATTVSRVLSQHPGLQGGNGLSPDDALTDSVAVRLYLSAKGSAIDSALRSARKGPHVPFARCTVSGLTRLPSHRGATALVASPTEDQWRLLSGRTMLTEWGFLNTLSEPSADLAGDTDVLLWSMTGRRTALFEPDDDDHADNRVLFLPGTSFKILERVQPAGDRRGQLLLREVGPNEISPEGRVQDNRASFDELATTSLTRYAERWAEVEPLSTVGQKARLRIRAVPGLAEQTEEKR